MWNILIVASATEGGRGPQHIGSLFNFALSEIVRVLDIRADRAVVLVPWSTDLAPLIAAGTIDTALSFDPKQAVGRSGLVPYYPPSAAPSEEDIVFFLATHISLSREAPPTFAAALKQCPPSRVLVLSANKEFDQLGSLLQSSGAPILAFASLTPIAEVAASLKVAPSRVTNLEQSLTLLAEDDDIARVELEPYVAFGLLVQKYFDAMLPDDDRRVVTPPG